MANQPLRGFVGQGMDGRKAGIARHEPFSFPVATSPYIFIPPITGHWKFILWGPGGTYDTGSTAGASGAYVEITKFLIPTTPVTITVRSTADTTVTFVDGTAATAGKASLAVAGIASGGDVNLNGTAGVASGTHSGNPGLGTGGGAGGAAAPGSGGAGAPAMLPYRGGVGGSSTFGGVAAGASEGGTQGEGLALAVFLHP